MYFSVHSNNQLTEFGPPYICKEMGSALHVHNPIMTLNIKELRSKYFRKRSLLSISHENDEREIFIGRSTYRKS
jgi:hypothetical protein